jgi:hypothetical protein
MASTQPRANVGGQIARVGFAPMASRLAPDTV